jgi:succinyl-diaminopimelate desuccinylase
VADVEGAMSDVVELARALISRPSVTPQDAGCQDLVAARLEAVGFACERLRLGEVDNLWATHGPLDGNDAGPVLVLLGHTDVVPPGPRQAWASDPFAPEIRDGVLYGRGAADMKGSVAAFVVAAERFVAAHPDHAGTLALLLTSDEEGDAIDGVRRVAGIFRERGQRIDWCITGEPSSKQRLGDLLRVGRRGSLSATLTVRGVQGHVAYPEKARNPVHLALAALAALTAHEWDQGYESFPPTSLQVSDIHAGTGANNVIPGELQVLFNLRYNPHWDAPRLERECAAILQAHGLAADDYQLRWHRSGEPFFTPEGPLREAAREVLADFAGAPPEESTGGGTSDARFIAPLGAHCIEVGPVNASIHKVDEHVRVADLEALPDLYLALVERLLARIRSR